MNFALKMHLGSLVIGDPVVVGSSVFGACVASMARMAIFHVPFSDCAV